MSSKRLHAKRHLSYSDQTEGLVWTRCLRDVEQAQVAPTRDAVTCKNCIKSLQFEEQAEREWRARREEVKHVEQ